MLWCAISWTLLKVLFKLNGGEAVDVQVEGNTHN
jgi:hypothetical protein